MDLLLRLPECGLSACKPGVLGRLPACLLVLCLALLPAVSQAQHWRVYTHSVGNQGMLLDGQLHGREHGGKRAFYLELVHALLRDMGHPQAIEEVPLARGLLQLQQRNDVVLFNLSQTPERLTLARWVGPTLEETDALYESVRHPTGIHSLADARDLPVCVLNGNTHDLALTAAGFSHIQRNNSYSSCFSMLAAGRVALVASADVGLAQKLSDAQVPASEVQVTAVRLGVDRGFIALSRGMPEAQVKQWRAALKRMLRDGRFQALYARYAQ
ncbi:TPA: substrate-binding periplasmic protein [Pseudomonas aeruginosa]